MNSNLKTRTQENWGKEKNWGKEIEELEIQNRRIRNLEDKN